MQFCEDHWARLRNEIDKRGLTSLVSEDGEKAATKLVREIEEGSSVDNFDPLMYAHNAIFANVLKTLGQNGLYLLGTGPEDPVEGYGEVYEGRTWPRCPLCYIGLAHEVSCTEPTCRLPKVDGYAWMLERAAEDAVNKWKSFQS